MLPVIPSHLAASLGTYLSSRTDAVIRKNTRGVDLVTYSLDSIEIVFLGGWVSAQSLVLPFENERMGTRG